MDQRHPFDLAVVGEAGDVERAVVHQVLVGGAVVGVPRPRGDELVDIVEALVVAAVEHHAVVLGDGVGATLVLEAAERGALDRRRAGIVGIDLDDPAEAVGLVRLLLDVEAVDVLGPGIPGGLRHAVALVGLGIGHLLGIAAEVAVEVLLGRQPGAPRRRAAGAVVQHAEHLAAGRIGRGLELVVAGRGAGHLERRVGRDAPAILAVDHLPGAAVAGDLDHRAAVRGQLDLDLRLGGLEVDVTARAQAREHQAGIGVFVVDDHEEAIARRAAGRQRMQADEVAVVAELLFLRGGGQVVRDRRPARRRRRDRPSGSAPAPRSPRARAGSCPGRAPPP